MENAQALQFLESAMAGGTLPARDTDFVGSLIQQSKTRGLSQKQWYWVVKIADRLAGPAPKPLQVADFTRVYAMFAKAREHLQRPKILLQTEDGMEIKLYVSGEHSRLPGVVNVVDTANNLWYGRIYQDGRWERTDRAVQDNIVAVEKTLQALAADPERIAAEYGKLTGNCCFCSRSLKDDRSTDVGYGPVCAKRFGLDWGKRK